MKRTESLLLCIALSLCLSWNAYCAETLRLRHIVSIYTDENGGALKQPESVFCTPKNLLLVADSGNNRLLKYTYADKNLTGGSEIKVAQLTYPLKVQVNSKGEMYALDGRQRRIVRLTQDGQFKDYLTPVGIPSPEDFAIMSFTIDSDDHIYILDTFSKRVIHLNTEGSYQWHINFPPDFGFFTDLSVDSKGSVFIVDSVQARVYSAAKDAGTFTPLGESLKKYAQFPTGIAVDKQGIIYLLDHNYASVSMLSQNGSFLGQQLNLGWNEGLLYYPTKLYVNESGEVFIADRGNNRIQIFNVVK
jgi:sugar lactone lactonase YvrE